MRNHHHHSEMKRHTAAMKLMSKEARQITALIAKLRRSVLGIEKEQQRTKTASVPRVDERCRPR
jgi:hypothetical protein